MLMCSRPSAASSFRWILPAAQVLYLLTSQLHHACSSGLHYCDILEMALPNVSCCLFLHHSSLTTGTIRELQHGSSSAVCLRMRQFSPAQSLGGALHWIPGLDCTAMSRAIGCRPLDREAAQRLQSKTPTQPIKAGESLQVRATRLYGPARHKTLCCSQTSSGEMYQGKSGEIRWPPPAAPLGKRKRPAFAYRITKQGDKKGTSTHVVGAPVLLEAVGRRCAPLCPRLLNVRQLVVLHKAGVGKHVVAQDVVHVAVDADDAHKVLQVGCKNGSSKSTMLSTHNRVVGVAVRCPPRCRSLPGWLRGAMSGQPSAECART